MRNKILQKISEWHCRFPWRMILISILLTLAFAAAAGTLQVTMRWSDLLPSGDPRTMEYNRIIDEFVSATSLIVVVEGEEKRIKEFADLIAPRLLKLVDSSRNPELKMKIEKLNRRLEAERGDDADNRKIVKYESEISELESRIDRPLFRRVDYKAEIDFLKRHGLLLMKEDNLENMKEFFFDPNLPELLENLNNAMEKEYVERDESLSTREKEDQAVVFLDGLQELAVQLKRAAGGEEVSDREIKGTADSLLFGEPYMLSYDERAVILNAIPNFTMMDTEYLISGTDAAQELLDELLADFPDVQAGLTGFIAIGRDEMVYAEKSLGYTSLIAAAAILLLLIFSFHMWVAPVLALGNLLIGLIWAVGAAALVVGQLNIMTQMMAVILLGLGIDFSIHIISGFSERRAVGDEISDAMEHALVKVGRGVLTGGMTTACAFLTLMISHSRGMKEMGLVTGIGLIAILLATFIFLPALLVLRERRLEKRNIGKKKIQRDITFRFLGNAAEWLGRRYLFTGLTAVAVTLLLLWVGSRIDFDHNYLNIEPAGLPSIELQDVILEKFDLGMDYALILTDDTGRSRETAQAFRDMGTVALTDDISLYLPSMDQQRARAPHIQEILSHLGSAQPRVEITPAENSRILEEIRRIEMNVIEIQDLAYLSGRDKVENKCVSLVGDPDNPSSPSIFRELAGEMEANPQVLTEMSAFQNVFAPYFQTLVIEMASIEPIRLEDLPDTILDRYSNSDRSGFLVTAFPADSVWKDSQFMARFVKDLEAVSPRVTGMPPVFRALIEIIGRDGRIAMILTLAIVFTLLLLDFRNPRHALLALIPLGIGLIWMIGFMRLTGMQLTVMNVMGFPMILGIGIDDGVHIVHRLRQEGSARIGLVFASTGKAILLTSLTTMLGFGSLVFSIWRGFGQLGGALFLGVAACFLTTVIFLSSIIGWIDHRACKKN